MQSPQGRAGKMLDKSSKHNVPVAPATEGLSGPHEARQSANLKKAVWPSVPVDDGTCHSRRPRVSRFTAF